MDRRSPQPYQDELDAALAAATVAGQAIQALVTSAETYTKTDGTPVTDADLAADRAIRGVLTERFPHDMLLTEEGVDDEERLSAERVWLVDPLDGTAEFVAGTGNYDVLVALIVNGRPVVAVACHPATGLICAAVVGQGAWLSSPDDPTQRPLVFTPVDPPAPPRLTTSRWFGAPGNTDALLRAAERLGVTPPAISRIGLTPRQLLGPKPEFDALIGLMADDPAHAMGYEWDFAVADLLVNEAGGAVTDLYGRLHRYNKPNVRNLGGLIVAIDPTTHARVLDALRPELTHVPQAG